MLGLRKPATALVLAAGVMGSLGSAACHGQTLKVAMGSDVKILDPIWTTAYIQAISATWSGTCSSPWTRSSR